MGQIVKLPGMTDPDTLRRALREMNTPELLLRRAIIGASLIGIGLSRRWPVPTRSKT